MEALAPLVGLNEDGSPNIDLLPRGVLLGGKVELTAVLLTEALVPPDEPERTFGDYTPGRYGWKLEDPVQFSGRRNGPTTPPL